MSIFLVIKLNEFENQKTNKKNANHNNNLSIDVRSIDWKKTRIGKQTKKNWKKRERINTKHTTHTHASDDVIRKTKNSFEEFDFFFGGGDSIHKVRNQLFFSKKKQLIFEEYFE